MIASPGELSLWWSTRSTSVRRPRPALDAAPDVDVAIVGGGFTGLWTALALLRPRPVAAGARAREGTLRLRRLGTQRRLGLGPLRRQRRRVVRQHGLDAVPRHAPGAARAVDDIAGTRSGGRHRLPLRQGRHRPRAARECAAGPGPGGVRRGRASRGRRRPRLARRRARPRAGSAATGVLGAKYSPHCARVHPARLVRGLAEVVERSACAIFEQHHGRRGSSPGSGACEPQSHGGGTVRADFVVRATEGWSSQLAGSKRAVLPVYSLMIATEPLRTSSGTSRASPATRPSPTTGTSSSTASAPRDDRIAFGGRGAPYHFGSTVDAALRPQPKVFDVLRATLLELFPALTTAEVTHRWGGPLGIPRDWYSSVGLDHGSGLAWAGGYVGRRRDDHQPGRRTPGRPHHRHATPSS